MNPLYAVGGMSILANAVLFWMFVGAREDVAIAIEQCNSSKLSAIAETERTVRIATESAYNERIAQLESMALNSRKALDSANAARISAVSDVSDQELTITRLQLEASIDEIPDSSECLNVFIPARAIDGMRDSEGNNSNSCAGGSRNDQICTDSRTTPDSDFPGKDFADITFGESLALWEVDRSTIRTQNAQLEAIGTLHVGE